MSQCKLIYFIKNIGGRLSFHTSQMLLMTGLLARDSGCTSKISSMLKTSRNNSQMNPNFSRRLTGSGEIS